MDKNKIDYKAIEKIFNEVVEKHDLATLNDSFEEENRVIYLYGEIGEASLLHVAQMVSEYNSEDNGLLKEERIPITIRLSTMGGSIYEALGIVNIIKDSKTPIYTHVDGLAFSAGFLIWSTGQKRTMGKNSTLMYHQPSGAIEGTLNEIIIYTEELERLHEESYQMILDNLQPTNVSILQQANENNQDIYINYKLAQELNIIKD